MTTIEVNQENLETTKSTVTEILTNGIATVKFTKVDGTIREMKATLSSKFMDHVLVENKESTRKINPDVRTVYDVDAKAWKSFRWDKLISVTTEEQ